VFLRASSNNDIAGVNYDVDGWTGGAYAGYNHQFVNNVVVGLEADFNYADIDGAVVLPGFAQSTEINWDGAAAYPFNNRNDFPADFFNVNVKAGAIYTTSGTGFRNDSLQFVEVNPLYAAEFTAFSPTKIFAPVGSNQLDQLFQVAGQPTPAVVRGFGIVFNDVDVAERTTIQLFAQDGTSLGTFSSPVRSDAGGATFVGVSFPDAIIARVRITKSGINNHSRSWSRLLDRRCIHHKPQSMGTRRSVQRVFA
jgi:hypothetical protein